MSGYVNNINMLLRIVFSVENIMIYFSLSLAAQKSIITQKMIFVNIFVIGKKNVQIDKN